MTNLERKQPEIWPILEYWEGIHDGCNCIIIVYHAGFETHPHCHKSKVRLDHPIFGKFIKESLVTVELRKHIYRDLWPKILIIEAEDDMKARITRMDHPKMSLQ